MEQVYFPGLTPGYGRKVIFLDIDGVLNTDQLCEDSGRSHSHPLFSPIQHLSTELVTALYEVVEATDSDVVISSTWRKTYNIQCLRAFLWGCGFKCTDRIIGTTRSFKDLLRHHEIADWLQSRGQARPKSFIIVDDNEYACPKDYRADRFVHCDPESGFDDRCSLRATALLMRLHMTNGALVTIMFFEADPKRPRVMVPLGGVLSITTRGLMQENLSYRRVQMSRATELVCGLARLNSECEMVVHWERELIMEPIGELRISVFVYDDAKRPSIAISLGGKQRLLESGVHKSYAGTLTEISLEEASSPHCERYDDMPHLNLTHTYVSLWKSQT